jgi:hypothetical protein
MVEGAYTRAIRIKPIPTAATFQARERTSGTPNA